MSWPGIEVILDGVKTALTSGMTAKLSALETAYADGVTLTAPNTTTGYWVDLRGPLPTELGSYTQPTVCIWPRAEVPLGDPNLPGQYDTNAVVVVAVVVRASSRAEMRKRLMRYTRAVKELLCAAGAVSDRRVMWDGTDWSDRSEYFAPAAADDYILNAAVTGFLVTSYDQL